MVHPHVAHDSVGQVARGLHTATFPKPADRQGSKVYARLWRAHFCWFVWENAKRFEISGLWMPLALSESTLIALIKVKYIWMVLSHGSFYWFWQSNKQYVARNIRKRNVTIDVTYTYCLSYQMTFILPQRKPIKYLTSSYNLIHVTKSQVLHKRSPARWQKFPKNITRENAAPSGGNCNFWTYIWWIMMSGIKTLSAYFIYVITV